jgi:predicted permease
MREWLSRLGGVLGRGRSDEDLAEELRLHLEFAAEDASRRTGVDGVAGRAAAPAGTLPSAMDRLRDQRGLPSIADLARDVRHGWRSLRRNVAYSTVTLLTLAIGIGANTAVFSVVNSVLLEPLPYPDPDRLVAVWHSAPGAPGLTSVSGDLRLSASMYFTYAEQNRTFERFGLWTWHTATVTGVAEPEQVRTLLVTDGTLQALGVQPALGRWLSDADQQPGARAVMLGYGYWQRRLGGDQSVIGRSITVDARPREIVGVMPEGFAVLDTGPEVIVPLAFDRARVILPGFGFQAVARLKPGVTIADASSDIARLVPIWMRSWPSMQGVSPLVYEEWRIGPALRPLKDDVVGNTGSVLWVLMGTIGIVLVIACANVANLSLARTEARLHELAVRASLGAGQGRIVRGLLIESLLLSLIGGALGLGLAHAALELLVAIAPATLPRLGEIAVDGRALAFTLAVAIASGLLFGAVPALKYAGPRADVDLRSGGRTATHGKDRHRARAVLVVAQVALALVLLVGAGLMIQTLRTLHGVEPGFTNPRELQTVRISIPDTLVPEPRRIARLQHDIADRLAALPGVESVGFASLIHMEGMEGLAHDWDVVDAEGRSSVDVEMPPLRMFKSVSPGFFQTTGTRLIAGREYAWTDVHDRRGVVMVSHNLARELWGGASEALGKRIQTLPGAPWREVIGVVEDVRENGVHEPAPAIVYWPSAGESHYRAGADYATETATFVLRSRRAGAENLLREVERAVWSVNSSLPIASPRTMQELYDRSLARTSFALVMLGIAAAMALALGLVGIYGVISYAVSQRTREIGIRLALGAQQRDVQRMFVRSGLTLTAAGIAAGVGAAAGLTRLMSSLLSGVSPLDPATYLVVPAVLAAAALLASYLPARRIAAVNPVEALKVE